jgi:hypothetical protein
MNTWVKVARYQLVRPANYLLLPLLLAFSVVLGAVTASRGYENRYLLSIVIYFAVLGMQAIERATGGWGLSMYFFRVPYLLNGPWYTTWLTSAVGLFALFVYGMWHGIVNHRWGILGTLAFIAVQALVVVPGAVVVNSEHWHVWSGAGASSARLSVLGLTGVVAALAVLLLVGGHATIRRATV